MAELAPGTPIGPYRLLFRLGRGGMGEVWAAARPGPSRVVALKLVHAPDPDSKTAVMFVDEARAGAELVHPAIVPTLDLGAADGWSYLAMELVPGPSLSVVLERLHRDRQRLEPATIAHLGERLASALAFAHHEARAGGRRLALVHRDVSPQNILLDRDGHVRLTDFGVAKTAIQSHLTRAGVLRGKPGYLSPEQIYGEPLDDRSDVFALGVVLYECAAVRRLFARNGLDASIDAALEAPIPPLEGVPPALAGVIASALRRDVAGRPNAPALRDALLEVGRALPGWASARSELGRRIEALFPGELDVDDRVRAARAALGEPDEPAPPRRAAPRRDATPVPAWPTASAHGPGPAIESVDTVRRAERRSPISAEAHPARRAPRGALALLGVGLATLVLVALGRSALPPRPERPPRPLVDAPAPPVVPAPIVEPPPPPVVQAPVVEAPAPPVVPAPAPPSGRPRPPAKTAPRPAARAEPSTPATPPTPEAPPARVATVAELRAEVGELFARLQAARPDDAARLRLDVGEALAGGHRARLERLRDQLAGALSR